MKEYPVGDIHGRDLMNPRTLLIGDIHGRDTWKKIIDKQSSRLSRIIFFGDYFDSFTIKGLEQIHNFNEIIRFKESSELEVIMLIGNHDHHYLNVGETYSGYQPHLQHDIYWTLNENKRHLQMVYKMDDILCSHAGISSVWLDNAFWWNEETLVEDINDLYKFQPTKFNFKGFDAYGDSPQSGPLWIRPKSLLRSNRDSILKKNYIQVFGHTEVKDIHTSFITSEKSMGNRYYNIDTLESGGYAVYQDKKLIAKQYVD